MPAFASSVLPVSALYGLPAVSNPTPGPAVPPAPATSFMRPADSRFQDASAYPSPHAVLPSPPLTGKGSRYLTTDRLYAEATQLQGAEKSHSSQAQAGPENTMIEASASKRKRIDDDTPQPRAAPCEPSSPIRRPCVHDQFSPPRPSQVVSSVRAQLAPASADLGLEAMTDEEFKVLLKEVISEPGFERLVERVRDLM